jgi:hypothetical protein
MSRYELGLCQQFNKEIHGFNENTSSPEIETHYICLFTFFSPDKFLEYIEFAKHYCTTIEIVETRMLHPGNEMVAIYKTFWLRIFQRVCRRWVAQRRYSRSSRLYAFLVKREYTNTSI